MGRNLSPRTPPCLTSPSSTPQVVHFAIALLLLGVAFRIISLTPWLKFTNHAAATLLILGTIAAAAAVRSGDDAHGPVERIPGVRNAVIEHEEYGERARNIFYIVAAFELLALGLARTTSGARFGRFALMGSALVGVGGSFQLYEAAEHGGDLVYAYAGGPGIRSGEPETSLGFLSPDSTSSRSRTGAPGARRTRGA
jgi:uncharacterized membrane protein